MTNVDALCFKTSISYLTMPYRSECGVFFPMR